MRHWALTISALVLAACSSESDKASDPSGEKVAGVLDVAPYEPVNDSDAPTVAGLEDLGYVRADYYPVGCVIPEQPEADCDATGAEFMDRSEVTYEDYDRYEYVCPAIEDLEIEEWKCRKQGQKNG